MSIRLKLTLYWTVLLATILAITGAAILTLFERRQWAALDAALLEEADTVSNDIARDIPSAGLIIDLLNGEKDLGPRRKVRLIAADGPVLVDGGYREADLPVIRGRIQKPMMLDGERHVFRYGIAPLTVAGISAYLEDGVDASAIRSSIARLRTVLALALPALLIVCASGGYWMAGRALAPMKAVTRELSSIGPRELSRRLVAPQPRDEIGRLTAVINEMLARVERASVAERRFAADAAHELRTPLAVLRSGLEVALSRERGASEYRGELQSALEEVVRLCDMAGDLLVIARLDGQVAIKFVPVNLGELLGELASNVQPLAEAKEIQFEIRTRPDVTVAGEPSYLSRMVLNLVDNAIKFTPSGGRVELALEIKDAGAVISVRDTGPGVKTAELPMLFERFFRGSSDGGGQGSGLGLSLCREIARLHGGEITAASRPEGGAEFCVNLPLRKSAQAEAREWSFS